MSHQFSATVLPPMPVVLQMLGQHWDIAIACVAALMGICCLCAKHFAVSGSYALFALLALAGGWLLRGHLQPSGATTVARGLGSNGKATFVPQLHTPEPTPGHGDEQGAARWSDVGSAAQAVPGAGRGSWQQMFTLPGVTGDMEAQDIAEAEQAAGPGPSRINWLESQVATQASLVTELQQDRERLEKQLVSEQRRAEALKARLADAHTQARDAQPPFSQRALGDDAAHPRDSLSRIEKEADRSASQTSGPLQEARRQLQAQERRADDAEATARKRSKELQDVTKKLQAQERRAEEAEKSARQANQDLQDATRKLKEAVAGAGDSAELRVLRNQVKAAQGRERRAMERCEKAEEELEEAEQKASAVGDQIAKLKRDMEKLRSEREESRKKEMKAVTENEGIRFDLDKAKMRASRFERELRAAEEKQEGLSQELIEAKRSLEEVKEEADSTARLRRERLQEAERSAAQAAKLGVQFRGAQRERDEARSQLEEARRREAQAAGASEAHRAEAEQALARVAVLTTQLEELRSKAEEAKDAAQTKWNSKLVAQLKQLQEEHDQVQRSKERLTRELQREQDEAAPFRRELQSAREAVQRLEEQLQQARTEALAYRRQSTSRLSSSRSGDNLRMEISDEDTIEAVGGLLLRSIQNVPEEKRANIRKQLLLCFHPDRNPAAEMAKKVTQMLNTSS